MIDTITREPITPRETRKEIRLIRRHTHGKPILRVIMLARLRALARRLVRGA